MPVELVSRSEEQTAGLARIIARLLRPSDVVFLKGQLGTGKTFFVRSAAREMDVTAPVTSPSFTMAQSYSGKVVIHHLDLYRLTGFSSADMIDFEPFFEGDAVTFVEWPESAETFLQSPSMTIFMEHVDENSRRIRLECDNPDLEKELEALIADSGY